MNDISKKVEELGIQQLPSSSPAGSYVPYVISGKCIYISGQVPWSEVGIIGWTGPIDDHRVNYGYEAARRCGMFIVKTISQALDGDWSRLSRIVKIGGFVQSVADFYQQPQVINGTSKLMTSLFGQEIGSHARFAVGVNVLPLNASVEVDAVVEIDS